MALHMARMARRMTPKVTIYTHGAKDLAQDIVAAAVHDDNIKVDSRSIKVLEKGAHGTSVIVHLDSGEEANEGFLVGFASSFLEHHSQVLDCQSLIAIQVHKPKSEVNGPFARQLGLELTEAGDIKTFGMFHESSVPGVFAVGDCGTPMKAVSSAIAMGSFGAGGLVAQLQTPEVHIEA